MSVLQTIVLILVVVWFIFLFCLVSFRAGQTSAARKVITMLDGLQKAIEEAQKREAERKEQENNGQKGGNAE